MVIIQRNVPAATLNNRNISALDIPQHGIFPPFFYDHYSPSVIVIFNTSSIFIIFIFLS